MKILLLPPLIIQPRGFSVKASDGMKTERSDWYFFKRDVNF